MERVFELASKAKGNTSPNPLVGCVIVKSGKIIAEGFHKKAGTDHAEVVALKKAKANAKGASLYVNLEPCCFTGKTAPCTKAIIKAGIKKVVIAMRDPNPKVSGKGVSQLKKASITVLEGLLPKEAERLNRPFKKFITQNLPYVTLKTACSLDGKIASPTGNSKWITNEESRAKAHEMRSYTDAIMVGINTVIKDDPRLNVRPIKKGAKHPLRVIVDRELRTPPDARVLHSIGGKVLIACGKDASDRRESRLTNEGAEIVRIKGSASKINLKSLMSKLAERDIVNLMLEGGATLYESALKDELVDAMAIFYAPILIGGSERYSLYRDGKIKSVKDATRLKNISFKEFGDNILLEGTLQQ